LAVARVRMRARKITTEGTARRPAVYPLNLSANAQTSRSRVGNYARDLRAALRASPRSFGRISCRIEVGSSISVFDIAFDTARPSLTPLAGLLLPSSAGSAPAPERRLILCELFAIRLRSIGGEPAVSLIAGDRRAIFTKVVKIAERPCRERNDPLLRVECRSDDGGLTESDPFQRKLRKVAARTQLGGSRRS